MSVKDTVPSQITIVTRLFENGFDDQDRSSKKFQHSKRLSKILWNASTSNFLARILGEFRKYFLVIPCYAG